MLDYSTIRDLYKDVDRVNSEHLIVCEWNMNKYQQISQYGLYKNPNNASSSYSSSDSDILTGENYIIYDDGTGKAHNNQEYYSSLSSVFQGNRPDPGIVLLQYFKNNTFVLNSNDIKADNLSVDKARYYPFSFQREYDYFNSAKIMSTTLESSSIGVSNPSTGNIEAASPFVVYEESFPCNKITIKVQNHVSVPDEFEIEILVGSTWQVAYSKASSSSSDFSTGILNLYYYNGSWGKEAKRINDFSQLTSPTSPTQAIEIKGLRLKVYKMTKTFDGSPTSLELIELSPRIEMDVTSYTESFSFNSSIGDQTSFGLPVGSIVASTGSIGLSNEDNQFLFTSTLNSLKMLNPDVEFKFYQYVEVPGDDTYAIPLKVMYSNAWNVGQDYSILVDLEDGFKFLREKSCPDILIQSQSGTPLSVCILTLLDNAGITGLEFKKTSNDTSADGEDVKIRNFFCKREQTLAEVLQELATATQCSMYFDPVGRLNVLTKERLTETVPESDSSVSSNGTDFWMVMDEDYSYEGGNVSEYSYISDYKSNVISYNEFKLNPVTDGDIVYHSYGPKKVPGLNNLPESVRNELTQDIPASALTFSNYTYGTMLLWKPSEDSESVMGAANLTIDLNNTRLKNRFTQTYTAYNEEDAIREIYNSTNNASVFPTESARSAAKQSLIIFLDRNEGYTISSYEGYVLIDKEYIKYRGKVFSINGQIKILFSREELDQEIRNIDKGSSIAILGLVVDVTLSNNGKNSSDKSKYDYVVIGDGRGKLGSEADNHYSLAENSDGIEDENRFKLTIGESNNFTSPGNLKASTKFNFIDKKKYKSVKESLGTLRYSDLQSYLGFLKIAGPKSNYKDAQALQDFDAGKITSEQLAILLNQANKQMDIKVPGEEFDDYVYLRGERHVYGQAIELPFTPNSISTRMRLYSPVKKIKNNQYLMSTNSSIAGIGFGLNNKNEGYFLEVESVGSGKDSVAKEAVRNNLRLYKIFLKNGKYNVELLGTKPVAAYTVSNTDVQVTKAQNVADPVFELEINIETVGNEVVYRVYYGNVFVIKHKENRKDASGFNSKKIFMFVRNDSQAIYEYIAAAARPSGNVNKNYFKSKSKLQRRIESGIIPVNAQMLFKNEEIQYYFNDFARLVREVKEYDIRFAQPAFSTALLDISRINPQYMIKRYKPTAFGAKLVVANTSSGPVILGQESNLPLYIVGIGIEELSTGRVTLKEVYDQVDEQRRKITDRERNISIYGPQSFSIDNQYVQSLSQTRDLMRWISRYCGRQRLKMTMEIFSNPLLELGDKVRVYDKSRGYYQDNPNYKDRVFVVSSIAHSVSDRGPTTNIELIEVGE